MEIVDTAIELMKRGKICNNCLGRAFANLLTGYSNEERGKIIRNFIAMLIDSGEKIEIDISNLFGLNLKNVKLESRDKVCYVCNDFFNRKIKEVSENLIKKLEEYEFETFLIGCKLSRDLKEREEKFIESINPEFYESIKSEINREIGKIVEKNKNKKMDREFPDINVLINLENFSISINPRSLFIFGKYKKIARGIPQATWYCQRCKGKGCEYCKGKGLLYPTSVQMIIEKPLLKVLKGKKSKIHAEGREDIDVRCLGWRPFVIEIVKPKIRKINLKKVTREINRSKKVKVTGLRIIKDAKRIIRFIKTEKSEKTYLAIVYFEDKIDKDKLKEIKKLENSIILQKTPLRIIHRRSDKLRQKKVKEISYSILNKKTLKLKITTSAGLYVKEFITGDESRTRPSIAEILNNKPKKVLLDVIKIHSKVEEILK